jgi:2-phosphoglycerate kinase
MTSKIIIIGGTYGVGKTTLAHNLACRLGIHHKVELGTIAKTLKYIAPNNKIVKDWSNYENYKTKESLKEKLHKESKLVSEILNIIIDKALYTGESYIIDGVQLLPQYLPLDNITYIALELKDEKLHQQRFFSPHTTKNKHLNNASYNVVVCCQDEIVSSATKLNLPVYSTELCENDLSEKIIRDLNL